ncbi:MAG: four helix bundle protein [Nitrospirae bacterium]|nr:four helix bundle protein [Nitrospirota bacterium]
MGGDRFEDLIVWKKARELARDVYAATKSSPFSRDFALRDQIRRASVSVMSNIAEGYERTSRAELSRFLAVAKGSCGEIRSQLYVARDQGYLDGAAFEGLVRSAEEVSRILSGFRRAVRSQVPTGR